LAFKRHNHSIIDAVKELGLEADKLDFRENAMLLDKYYSIDYFKDFDNLKVIIEDFIFKYKKFPTTNELRLNYNIPESVIRKYGGIEKIRLLMEYNNSNDFIDDNGFKNKSSYEYITAQFLIHNNVFYLREQHPFPSNEKNYRSDFMFIVNGKQIHCEI